ncbi:MAG: universal stress protein [Gemmatimonadales bacterium]
MDYQCIVAATDGTAAARHAVEVAARLASQSGARLRLLSVVPAPASVAAASTDPPHAGPFPDLPAGKVETAVAVGLPGVEIARYAETEHADLLVLGRPFRSHASRRLLGDTGDAVARRAAAPCLFVPPVDRFPERVLAALDGTERGLIVMKTASDYARAAAGRLRAITVEPSMDNEPHHLASALPTARSERLSQALDRLFFEDPSLLKVWDRRNQAGDGHLLGVRRGDPVAQILEEVESTTADVLAVGFHRGGPPGLIEGRSVGRRLLHSARCAVLTVPL